MKKLFITAVVTIVFGMAAFADGGKKDLSDNNITYAALNQFKSDFKSADNVVWTVNSNYQSASFSQNNVDYTAFYDFDGQSMGITQKLKRVPMTIRKEVASEYKGYKVNSVIKYETANTDEPVVYFVDVKKGDNEMVLKTSSADKGLAFFKQVN